MGAFVFSTETHSEVSQLYHEARDHLKRAKEKGKTCILDRYQENDRHRVHLQSEGSTKEKVIEWDRGASGPKQRTRSF